MDGLLGHILRCGDHRVKPVREMIQERGFKGIYAGESDNWDAAFDEFSTLNPRRLVVVGYDKDLDCNTNRWMYDYKEKESSDPVTIYSMDLDEAIRKWHLPTREVEICERKVKLPFLQPHTRYVPLPIERTDSGLFLSRSREATFPVELMSRMYILEKNKERLLKQYLMSYCGVHVYYGPRSEPQCEGEMTLPVLLMTVKGKAGMEYLYTGQALSENIGVLGKVIGVEKSQIRFDRKVGHNRKFVAKYQPLLKGLK